MNQPEAVTCDVLVIGSGAGGMSAAITAQSSGLDVLLIEKEPWLGGTTAISGGWLWIPCNPLAQRAGIADSLDKARAYLQHELEGRYDDRRIEAFLENGPKMVAFLEQAIGKRFILGDAYPDYHPDAPGALSGGRALCPQPYDGRALGDKLHQLRPPIRELTLFGIKVGSGPDFQHFANAQRSLRSALYVAGRVATHFRDVLLHGRDLLLMSGNALIGRLVEAAYDRNVRIWLSSPAQRLFREGDRVVGAMALHFDAHVRIVARHGVILATGGFSHDATRRSRLFPRQFSPQAFCSLAAPGNTGDGLQMAEKIGADVEETYVNPAAWMPMSRVPYADGTFGTYPHSFDRGKPGVIAVMSDGNRFVNESDSYHDFCAALVRASATGCEPAAFLICDHRFIRRYGLGIAKPFPVPLRPYLRSGYLKRGQTLEELAVRAGIDPAGLSRTISSFNAFAAQGRDPQFGRGKNANNYYNGDAAHEPNPCLATIEKAPFYSVKVFPGDLNTFDGLNTDENARVLDGEGRAITGLYAVGADMASIFAGNYPGPGINIGAAMTFGYAAARHIAALAELSSRSAADMATSLP